MKLYKSLVITGLTKNDIFFKNFAGEERQYNARGKRNFQLKLNSPSAIYRYGAPGAEEHYDVNNPEILNGFIAILTADGWHVKVEPATEQWPVRYSLKINVHYSENSGPHIYLVNNANQPIEIQPEALVTLDRNLIDYADIHISPFNYNENEGGNDQSAYLRHMYFKFAVTDPLAEKYKAAGAPDPAMYMAPQDGGEELEELPFN